MKYLFYSLIPLALLIFFALIACILSYILLIFAGDIVPLDKLISKATLIFLILSIFPLKRYLSLSWSDMGFAPKAIFFKQLLIGLGMGILTLLPVLLVIYGLEINVVDSEHHWNIGTFIGRLLLALFLGLLISSLEEPLFRGILLEGFRKKMAMIAAVILSSVYYGALHFLKSESDIAYEDITLGSGFELVLEAFANYLKPEVLQAFIALVMVGIFLALIRINIKQSMGLCIGYHASWVWLIRINRDIFNINYQSEYLYLVSNYNGIVGPLVSVWMAVACLIYLAYLYCCKQKNSVST